MNISYKWLVEKLTVKQNNKLVISVEWRCYGVDEDSGFSAAMAGVIALEPSDTFIPYDQLTEQKVFDWCFEPKTITQTDKEGNVITIVKHLKDEGEAQVAGQIARQLGQKAAEPALPWAQIPA
jgi:hypothetical protein